MRHLAFIASLLAAPALVHAQTPVPAQNIPAATSVLRSDGTPCIRGSVTVHCSVAEMLGQMVQQDVATALGYAPANAENAVSIKSGGAKCDGVTDDTAMINAVLAANRVVMIPTGTGTCLVSGPLKIVLDHSTLAGAGLDSGIFKSTTANQPVIQVGPGLSQVTLAGFSVDRGPVAVSGGNGIEYLLGGTNAMIRDVQARNQWFGFALGGIAYGQLVGTIAANNYSDGVFMTATATNPTSQWTLLNTISQGNDGWGYNVVSQANAGPLIVLPWNNVTAFANSLGGAAFHGQSSAPIYDVTISSGVFSTDGGDEVYFDTFGGQIKIAGGTFIELAGTGNTGRGLVTGPTHLGSGIHATGNVGDIQVTGAFISANSQYGVLSGAFRSTFTGNVTMQNSQTQANAYKGMDFENTIPNSTVLAVGNRSGNLNNTSPQGVGIGVLNGVGATVVGNDLSFNGLAGLAIGSNAKSIIAHGNMGFAIEASGVGNIPANATSVVITHGLDIAPTQVWITPNTFQGGGQIWADTINPASFTVHVSAAYSSLIGFSWMAKSFNN